MRAAICQMNGGADDVDANVATAIRLIGEAADGGADLVVLPELFAYYGSQRRMREMAEPPGGPILQQLAACTTDRSIWLLGGSICEADGGRVFNTSFLFDRSGEHVARYRKIHLYDVELADQRPIQESALFAAGEEVVTHDVEGMRLGLSICYDLRFPELYRGLMTSGATVLAVPSAFQEVTGRAHWEPLLRARAIEEQSYVLAAAQWGPWGPPGAGHRTHGNAMIVDPWGEIVTRAPSEGDGVWFADLDPERVRSVRARLPALSHRRLGTVC
jgi:deaminated glutathione amidase